ncbi:MAG: penicillin-binding protein 2 [Gammaproteobacteria bacterium]|nr:penicillin-binding protein 2 [Gammaproteobacteria bacterium]
MGWQNNNSNKTAWPIAWRVWLVQGLFVLAAVTLFVRVGYLQLVDQEFLVDQGERRYLRVTKVSAHRGQIVDRHGQALAVSSPVDSIWANPKLLLPMLEPQMLDQLARTLGQSSDWLERHITRHHEKEFVYLRRHLAPSKASEVMALHLPGLHRLREYRRYYPAGEITGHLVGFTDIDDRGLEGLELAYDHWLNGMSGSKRVLQDRYGNTIKEVENIELPQHGRELVTSLDLRIQYLAYRALKTAVAKHQAKAGSLVMIKVGSGEVLAMVNQPSFNPNDRAQLSAANYRNRAVTDIFEPGSSFKPLIMAAALEGGSIHPLSNISTAPGYVRVGQHVVEDAVNHGQLTATGVLTKSSNVGMTKIALGLEAEDIWQMLSSFGFGQLTGSDFPGESAGLLHSYAYWQPIHQATLSYGYGMSSTPLQLAQAYAAIADDGQRHPISLLKVGRDVKSEKVLSGETAEQLIAMLETVVSDDGTGGRAAVTGYRIAGKTGTAHKVGAEGYDRESYTAIFAGMAPASDPQLAMVVVITEPQGDAHYGGEVAAPVFAEVMSGALRLQSIAPDRPQELKVRKLIIEPKIENQSVLMADIA